MNNEGQKLSCFKCGADCTTASYFHPTDQRRRWCVVCWQADYPGVTTAPAPSGRVGVTDYERMERAALAIYRVMIDGMPSAAVELLERNHMDKARRMASAALEAAGVGDKDAPTWQELFDRTAKALGCLPSCFTDGNGHVIGKAKQVMAENARLSAQLAAGEWVKCSERLPMAKPYSARVLICARYGDQPDATTKIIIGRLFGVSEWREHNQMGMATLAEQGWTVTHWRPLPAPPSDPKTGGAKP